MIAIAAPTTTSTTTNVLGTFSAHSHVAKTQEEKSNTVLQKRNNSGNLF